MIHLTNGDFLFNVAFSDYVDTVFAAVGVKHDTLSRYNFLATIAISGESGAKALPATSE